MDYLELLVSIYTIFVIQSIIIAVLGVVIVALEAKIVKLKLYIDRRDSEQWTTLYHLDPETEGK